MKSLEDLERAFERGLKEWEGTIVKKHAARMGQKIIREVKRETPVGETGNLRRSWFCKVKKESKDVLICIRNNTEYAASVNDGHRIVRGGRTVGQTEGKHMLEKGLDTYQANYMKNDVENMLDDLKKAIT